MTKKIRLVAIFLALLAASLVVSHLDLSVSNDIRLVSQGLSVTSDWLGGRDRLRRLPALNRVLRYINESYVDPQRVDPPGMFRKILDTLASSIAEVRVRYPGPRKAVLVVDKGRKEFDTDLPTIFALSSSVSDVLKFVRSHQRGDKSDEDLEVIAIHGTLSTLDPHSVYLSKEIYRETKVGTTGHFGGLGVVIGIRDHKLTIISPLDDTPAARAGLRAGDVVTKIGDESTVNMFLTEAVERMRGPKGAPINISIMRKGWTEARDFTIVRDIIQIVSVESDLLPGSIGYARVKHFQGKSAADLKKQIHALTQRAGGELKGLILDLRNDPGGLLEEAVAVSDLFLSEGIIVSTVGLKNRFIEEKKATAKGTEPDYPMVVLVNAGSASASEIVAGALQRQDRALVLGQRTFGKGTVQSIYPLGEDSALKLTIAKYLTPGKISIQSIGIGPDIRTTPVTASKEELNIFPNHNHGRESNLDGHFDRTSTPIRLEPAVSVNYLEKIEKPEEDVDDEIRSRSQKSAEERAKELLSDFQIEISRDLLLKLTQSSRDQALPKLGSWIKPVQATQEKRIEEALRQLEIDWAPGRIAGHCLPPSLKTKFTLPKSSKSQQRIGAGKTVQFSVTAYNPGPCELYRVAAISSSDDPLFGEREFIFGRIKAGASIERSAEITVPRSHSSGLVKVDLRLQKGVEEEKPIVSAEIAIQAVPKPEFAFRYVIFDGNHKESQGNGNGLLEKGEVAEVLFSVKNVGRAATEEASASIKIAAGKSLSLKKGRASLKGLEPGKEKEASFLIEILPGFNQNSFSADLLLSDLTYRQFLTKKLDFPVFDPKEEKKEKKRIKARKGHVEILPFPSRKAFPIASLKPGGSVESSLQYGDFLGIELLNQAKGWVLSNTVGVDQGFPTPNKLIKPIFLQPPSISVDWGQHAFRMAKQQFLELKGEIFDDVSVQDVFVLVNEKKVFYQSFPDQLQTTHPFSASIPLEPGQNRILIMARDHLDLIQRESVIIRRTDNSSQRVRAD